MLWTWFETLGTVKQGNAAAEPGDLGFDAGDSWDRKTKEGERRYLKADVLLTIFEALIEYDISFGGDGQSSCRQPYQYFHFC